MSSRARILDSTSLGEQVGWWSSLECGTPKTERLTGGLVTGVEVPPRATTAPGPPRRVKAWGTLVPVKSLRTVRSREPPRKGCIPGTACLTSPVVGRHNCRGPGLGSQTRGIGGNPAYSRPAIRILCTVRRGVSTGRPCCLTVCRKTVRLVTRTVHRVCGPVHRETAPLVKVGVFERYESEMTVRRAGGAGYRRCLMTVYREISTVNRAVCQPCPAVDRQP